MAATDFRMNTGAVNAPRFHLKQEDKSPEVKGAVSHPGSSARDRRRRLEYGGKETRVGETSVRTLERPQRVEVTAEWPQYSTRSQEKRDTTGGSSHSGNGSREEGSKGEGTRGHQSPGRREVSEETVRTESGRPTRLPLGWVTPDQRYITWNHLQRQSQRSLEERCGGPRHGSADEPWSQASAASGTG